MNLKSPFFQRIFFFFLFLVGFILAFVFQNNLKETIYTIFFPFQEKIWRFSQKMRSLIFSFSLIEELKKENEILKKENQELKFQLLNLLDLKQENEKLRKSLNLGVEKEFELVLAKMASKDIFENTFLINKGSNHGISEGLPVITSGKVLVGRISKVYKNFSKIELISKENFSFDVKIGEGKILAKATGMGDFKLKISLLPLEFEPREKELVFSSSLGGLFPDNLLIGELKEVKKLPLENFKEGEVELFFPSENLDYLFVITKW